MSNPNLDLHLRVKAIDAQLARFERWASIALSVSLALVLAGYGMLMQASL